MLQYFLHSTLWSSLPENDVETTSWVIEVKLLFLYLVQDSHAGGRWGTNQVTGRTPDKRNPLLPIGFKTETC